MFRLLKSGLPKDPVYPADLEGLGYFVNEEDEVRMISNPRAYFNFFLTKNDRHNTVQREAMNSCLREEVLNRLHKIGMETVRLPLGAEETDPHIPILVSSNISEKKRVIILFYEHTQDLGIFAYRIVGGRGGINAGSAINFVKYIQSLSGPDSNDSPGIILANLGQLRWWRRGRKAVTHATWFSLPQKSAVSGAYRFDLVKNTVQDNRNTAEHVAYVFNHVVKDMLAPDAMLEVIGVSVGAVEVVDFFNKPQNWAIMEPRLTALALIATFHQRDDISNPWFADWLRKRGRAYIISTKPASTPLAPSDGNTDTNPNDNTTTTSDCYGCPVYSLGEPYYSELMLQKGYKVVLEWFQEVIASGEGYENPEVVIMKVVEGQEEDGQNVECEEPNNTEIKVEELKSKEYTAEEAEAEEPRGERTENEEPKVDELNVAELSIKDPYIQEIKEAEHKSRIDLGEEVWEEEMKKQGLDKEDREHPKIKEDAVTEERAKEERAKRLTDACAKLKVGESKGKELKECTPEDFEGSEGKEEGSNIEAHKVEEACEEKVKAEATARSGSSQAKD